MCAASTRPTSPDLRQPRVGNGFAYIVRKRPGAGAGASVSIEEADAATDAILRALKRAANFGQKCPTNLELARTAGLATRDQAAGGSASW
jgi:hypothetical protein